MTARYDLVAVGDLPSTVRHSAKKEFGEQRE